MTTCDETLSLLDAWLDGELLDARAHDVERHLADCDDCRDTAAAWRVNDAALRELHADHAIAAARVADRVLAGVRISNPHEPGPPREQAGSSNEPCGLEIRTTDGESAPDPATPSRPAPRTVRWTTYAAVALAAAAGFLVAAILFQPWRGNVRIVEVPAKNVPRIEPEAPRVVPAVARFTTATGPVEFREPTSNDWQAVADLKTFVCPSDTALRTGPNVKAELRTSDGGVLRMDDSTSLVLRGPDEVEMQSGQLWCRAPQDQSFKVVAGPTTSVDPPLPNAVTPGPWAMTCAPAASCMATSTPDRVRITSSGGELELLTRAGRRTVARGETVAIDGDTVVSANSVLDDPLLSTRWIHPLLVRRGHGDDELGERVDEMLARVGATKLSHLYEDEIRSLGEYAVLPLLRFVQSDESTNDPLQRDRRRAAMRIIADLAPTWSIGDLVGLLADPDPTTRHLAATALARLTGEQLHLAPAGWETATEADRTSAVVAWQTWWTENRDRYPSLEDR